MSKITVNAGFNRTVGEGKSKRLETKNKTGLVISGFEYPEQSRDLRHYIQNHYAPEGDGWKVAGFAIISIEPEDTEE